MLDPETDEAPAPRVKTELLAPLPERVTVPVLTVRGVVRVALVTEVAVVAVAALPPIESPEAVPVKPEPDPANPVAVKMPVEGTNDNAVEVVFCGLFISRKAGIAPQAK